MKHLKTYEKLKELEIDDWVYCETDTDEYDNSKFIGQYINVSKRTHYPYFIKVKPENQNDDGKRLLYRREIIAFSKNKKDLDIYLNTNKYNL